MSVWTVVLQEAGVRGGTAVQVASHLGLPLSLVQAVLDHAERLGVVAVAGDGCASGCLTGPAMPPSCAGCPLSAS